MTSAFRTHDFRIGRIHHDSQSAFTFVFIFCQGLLGRLQRLRTRSSKNASRKRRLVTCEKMLGASVTCGFQANVAAKAQVEGNASLDFADGLA